MHPDTTRVADHMKNFGFHILGRAIYDATFSEMMRPFAHTLSVVHAAHGAEMIVKARIAQEHPLLIFTSLPRSKTTGDMLGVRELFEHGRTFTYSELPEILWATTGYRMKKIERFQEFGALRNGLVHFAPLNIDAAAETLKFVFEVLDPMAWDFWNETFVEYSQDWDDVIIAEGYLQEHLGRSGIRVHPDTQRMIEQIEKH